MLRILQPYINAALLFLLDQRERYVLWFPVLFGIGIMGYFALEEEPSALVPSVMVVGSLCGMLFFHRYEQKDLNSIAPYLHFFVVMVFWMSAGFSLAMYKTHQMDAPVLLKETRPVYVTGRIHSISRVNEKLRKVVLGDLSIERMEAKQTPRYIRLRSYHFNEGQAVPGQRVKLLAKLTPPSRPVLPGGYDFQRKAFFDEIGATGFSLSEVEYLDEEGNAKHTSVDEGGSRVEKARYAINAHIEQMQDASISAISKALVTGERTAIKKEDMDAIRSAGLAHLLAISGLHIGLVSGFVFFMVRFLLSLFPFFTLHYPIKKIAAISGILSAVLYMFLAGATIPTQRAVMMAGIVFCAIILDRKAMSLRLVSIAALIVLVVRPDVILGASFQLSFSAVLALIAFYEGYRARRLQKEKDAKEDGEEDVYVKRAFWLMPLYYLGGVILTTLIATFATSIFSVYHFGRFNVYGVFGNMVAMPLMSFLIMPCAIFGVLFQNIEWLSKLFLQGMQYGLEHVLAFAHYLHELSYASIQIPQSPLLALLWISFGFVFLCLVRGYLKLRLVVFGVCVCAALLSSYMQPKVIAFLHNDPIAVSYLSSKSQVTNFEEGYVSAPKRTSNFVNNQMREFWAKDPIYPPEQYVACDAVGCLIDVEGVRIMLLNDLYQFSAVCAEDEELDVLVVKRPVPRGMGCVSKNGKKHKATVLDFFDFWREGSHAISLERISGKLHITSVEDMRGFRPWTTPWQRYQNKKARNNE